MPVNLDDERNRQRHKHFERVLLYEAFGRFQTTVGLKRTGPVLHWPSGIAGVDRLADGGFYLFSVVGGFEKLGKSMVALISSLMAARTGWRVYFCDGEDGQDLTCERVELFLQEDDEASWPDWMGNFEYIEFGPGENLQGLASIIVDNLAEVDQKVLVVINSINRLAKYSVDSDKGTDYFRALRQIGAWAWSATRLTGGEISTLLVSEVNRAGGYLGQDVGYTADLLLKLEGGEGPREVKMDLKSRRTMGGDLGVYTRHYAFQRFIGQDERFDTDEEEYHQPDSKEMF